MHCDLSQHIESLRAVWEGEMKLGFFLFTSKIKKQSGEAFGGNITSRPQFKFCSERAKLVPPYILVLQVNITEDTLWGRCIISRAFEQDSLISFLNWITFNPVKLNT